MDNERFFNQLDLSELGIDQDGPLLSAHYYRMNSVAPAFHMHPPTLKDAVICNPPRTFVVEEGTRH